MNNLLREKLVTYLPVFYVYIFSLLISLNIVFFYDLNLRSAVLYFLGFFSLIFGSLKLFNLKSYINSLLEYDFVAQRFVLYGYLFPFFEILFGVLFILQIEILWLEYLCLSLFLLNTVVIANALEKRRNFTCACMGGLFNLPLSTVSLVESLTMVIGIIFLIFKM